MRNIGRSRGDVVRHNVELQEKLAVALDRIDELEDAIRRHQDLVSEPGDADTFLYDILEREWETYGDDSLKF